MVFGTASMVGRLVCMGRLHPYLKTLGKPENFASDKRLSLFCHSISDEAKIFVTRK
jgi:hypothetical protein